MNRKDIDATLDGVDRLLADRRQRIRRAHEVARVARGRRALAAHATVKRLIAERTATLVRRGWLDNAIEFNCGVDRFNAGDFEAAVNWFESGNYHDIAVQVWAIQQVVEAQRLNPKDLA